jgi:hypothetical protein
MLLVPPQCSLSSLLTAAACPSALSATCALPAAFGPSAMALAEDASTRFGLVVAVPEGGSPLTAGVLVVDAESSMGAGRPTDCASFTTSLATCSAITVSGTVVAQDSMSESCSCSEPKKDFGVSGVDCCESRPAGCPRTSTYDIRAMKSWRYSPSVRCYKSPQVSSWRFRRIAVCEFVR